MEPLIREYGMVFWILSLYVRTFGLCLKAVKAMLELNIIDARCIAVTGRAVGHGMRIKGEIFNTLIVHSPSRAVLSIAFMIFGKELSGR
jgi:hypothetical protein